MAERRVSWVPSLVFGGAVLLAFGLGLYARESAFYGLFAALLYTMALGATGVMERRMGQAFNVPNLARRQYRWFTTGVLLVAAVLAPGWVTWLVLVFGLEGIAQLRHSPYSVTKRLKRLWTRSRD